ncbi:uncharacterized protein Dyak_GE28014 [Drosophila yakuba]|uniref:Uncharacterized protein n=1 Tax=Drosophila yakuba TaxID=7245 RepID=A0A0R1E5U5_DROYA|nr:uncharacterized protein Dyak_GE28014 [Drosophila yakuba]
MKHIKLFLLVVWIGIACQNSAADLDVRNTLNNMKIDDANDSWSRLSRKLHKDLIPKFERLSDRLESMEQDILALKMALQ